MTSDTFTQVVATQILFPITETSTGAPGMPAVDQTLPSCDDVDGAGFCVDDQDQAIADIAVYVGAVAGTGVTAEQPTDGKSIFTANCGSCHTLADAGTSGTVGPNLDDAKPTQELVVDQRDERPGRDAVVQGLARRAADPGRRGLRLERRRQVTRGRVSAVRGRPRRA